MQLRVTWPFNQNFYIMGYHLENMKNGKRKQTSQAGQVREILWRTENFRDCRLKKIDF